MNLVPVSEELLIAIVRAGVHDSLSNGGGDLVRGIVADELAPLAQRIATIEGHQTAALAAQAVQNAHQERRHKVLVTVIAGTFGLVGPLVLLVASKLFA